MLHGKLLLNAASIHSSIKVLERNFAKPSHCVLAQECQHVCLIPSQTYLLRKEVLNLCESLQDQLQVFALHCHKAQVDLWVTGKEVCLFGARQPQKE